MATTTALIFVSKFAISIVLAIALIYLILQGPKKENKAIIDRMLSQLLQFIIYIWLAKLLWELPLLIKHPLSVLAYPSNSTHFYTAGLFWLIHLAIKYRKSFPQMMRELQYFLWMILTALLIYEFADIIAGADNYDIKYFGFLTALVIASMVLYKKKQLVFAVVFNVWLLGSFVFSLEKGYYPVFNYFPDSAYFIVVLLIFNTLYLFYVKKYKYEKK